MTNKIATIVDSVSLSWERPAVGAIDRVEDAPVWTDKRLRRAPSDNLASPPVIDLIGEGLPGIGIGNAHDRNGLTVHRTDKAERWRCESIGRSIRNIRADDLAGIVDALRTRRRGVVDVESGVVVESAATEA